MVLYEVYCLRRLICYTVGQLLKTTFETHSPVVDTGSGTNRASADIQQIPNPRINATSVPMMNMVIGFCMYDKIKHDFKCCVRILYSVNLSKYFRQRNFFLGFKYKSYWK